MGFGGDGDDDNAYDNPDIAAGFYKSDNDANGGVAEDRLGEKERKYENNMSNKWRKQSKEKNVANAAAAKIGA